jgi:hypothetical protein
MDGKSLNKFIPQRIRSTLIRFYLGVGGDCGTRRSRGTPFCKYCLMSNKKSSTAASLPRSSWTSMS